MSTAHTTPTPADAPPGPQYREEMIRQAAYFRAEQRRRHCVEHEVADWLAAEQEVDEMLIRHPRCP
jgi:hypothetical protein